MLAFEHFVETSDLRSYFEQLIELLQLEPYSALFFQVFFDDFSKFLLFSSEHRLV